MKVPAIVFGAYPDVKPRVGKISAQMRRGARWTEALQANQTVDTEDEAGLLVLDGPSPLLRNEPHFHIYLPWVILEEAIAAKCVSPETEQTVFDASLASSWGVCGLLAPKNLMWVYPKERHWPLVHAALRFWTDLEAVGPRYSLGSTTGEPLWMLNSNIKYVLANLGVPVQILNASLPSGGLRAVITSAQPESA